MSGHKNVSFTNSIITEKTYQQLNNRYVEIIGGKCAINVETLKK